MCDINNYDLERVIDRLQDAIKICRNVSDGVTDEYDRNYPYAVGYSRVAMEDVVENLMKVIKSKSKYDLDCI